MELHRWLEVVNPALDECGRNSLRLLVGQRHGAAELRKMVGNCEDIDVSSLRFLVRSHQVHRDSLVETS